MNAPAPTLPLPELTVVTEPGVYPDMPADVYHADPVPGGSLSTSGARMLLPPSCPAKFAYERTHGRPPKNEFDFGHAAHRLALGAGAELVVVDAPDWRTKAAREARDEARANGAVPLLAKDHGTVTAMAAALREHPAARALFDASSGRPEQSLFWVDKPSGIWRRARLDWYPVNTGRRLLLVDYKSCRSADPESLERPIHDYGYHMQAACYLDGAKALGLHGDTEPAFLFVFQEKEPPYVVTVAELTLPTLRIGQWLNRKAIGVYRECSRSGRWPGYTDEVEQLALPAYLENRYLEEMNI